MGRKLREYDEEYFANQTPSRLLWKILGIAVSIILVLTCVGFGLRWVFAARDVVSPENVKAQWQFAYDYTESLNAIGSQWCTAKSAEDAATDPTIKEQRTTQRIAIENNYARVKAQYDARLEDAFRAKWVKPPDVPDRAPTLQETTAHIC